VSGVFAKEILDLAFHVVLLLEAGDASVDDGLLNRGVDVAEVVEPLVAGRAFHLKLPCCLPAEESLGADAEVLRGLCNPDITHCPVTLLRIL
jgi:hypothetical protein